MFRSTTMTSLASSSLILADEMERVPSKEIGAGNFVIGDTHIRAAGAERESRCR